MESVQKTVPMRFLVVIETRKVKGFLMASTLLRETRGASLLLDRLNRRETKKLLDSCESSGTCEVVYLGGGSGRVLFEEKSDAENFARKVRELYRLETGSVRLVARVFERGVGNDGQAEPFSDWLYRAVGEAHRETPAGPEVSSMISGRWIRPCTSCGLEPASQVKDRIPEEHRVCESCHRKREQIWEFYGYPKGHSGRKGDRSRGVRPETGPIPVLEDMKQKWPDSILTTVLEKVCDREGPVHPNPEKLRLRLPQDFNHIGEAATPSRYFGFLYADANGMGKIIQDLSRKKLCEEELSEKELIRTYKALSEIIDLATREAAAEAVLEEVALQRDKPGREDSVRYLPAEFIIAGGDDLILAVPAQAALGVAWRFVEGFRRKTVELQTRWVEAGKLAKPFEPEGLTTSAGVVLSHINVPAVLLLDLAEDLLKLAKRRAADGPRDENGDPQGTIDFIVLPDFGSDPVKDRRRREYEGGRLPSGGTVHRTERPYTAEGLKALLASIGRLKEEPVARGKLRALYDLLFHDSYLQTQFEALKVKERLSATGAFDKEEGTINPLRRLIEELSCFPFRPSKQGDWTTPLSELVEAYEFVPLGYDPNLKARAVTGQEEEAVDG